MNVNSGTYLTDDVEFLLTPIVIESIDTLEKEKLIQSKKSHYSEMITYEKKPSDKYKNIFYSSLSYYEKQFSQDVVNLAYKILEDYQNEESITLVSLARAGTPVGVLLKRFLSVMSVKPIKHYCVSIIRDIGLDLNAISYILKNNKDSSIVFIDGWTGKGVIGSQLTQSIDTYNAINNTAISGNLYVALDISGTAYYGASHNDYLIPSAIFNSTISGLISRTIYNKNYLTDSDFHGYVCYNYLKEDDISIWFVEHVLNIMLTMKKVEKIEYFNLKQKSIETIDYFRNNLNLKDVNYIKPGIGESTRVMLRRVPETLYVQSKNHFAVQHLILLAEEKNVPVIEKSDLFYNSVAIIKELD